MSFFVYLAFICRQVVVQGTPRDGEVPLVLPSEVTCNIWNRGVSERLLCVLSL